MELSFWQNRLMGIKKKRKERVWIMKRKIFSLLCCTALLMNGLPNGFVRAEQEDVAVETAPVAPVPVAEEENGATPERLEKALIAVRSKITIPQELQENFEYYYQEGGEYSEEQWMFTWENDTQRIVVTCDKDYHIKGYSNRLYDQKRATPVYLKSELEPVAEKFVKRVLPEAAPYLQLSESKFNSFWNGCYSFVYERVEQGILMPENTVTVQINAETGEISQLSSAFVYGISIPAQKAVLTAQQAAKKMETADAMQLVYRNYYERDPKTQEYKMTAKLVYVPKDSYRSVDAITGEVYTERVYNRNFFESITEEQMNDAAASAGADRDEGGKVTLSEAEQKEIEALGEYLSKEEAIAAIKNNSSLYLEDTLTNFNASLKKQEDYWGNDIYVWEVEMNAPTSQTEEKESYQAYAYAKINAKSGSLLSFSSNIRSFYDREIQTEVKKNYTMEQCKQTAEKLLKANLNQLYKNSRLDIQEEGVYLLAREEDKDIYGGYDFTYIRVNEGVDYPYHSLSVSVDAVSGKVVQMSYWWNNKVTFESPKNILSAAEAFSAYMNNDQYHLIYEMVNGDDSNKNLTTVRLVYRNDLTPAAISPYTGEPVQRNGAAIEKTKQYSYNDIDILEQKRQILLLADLGFGFEGGSFLKDQAITTEEWNTFSQSVLYSNSSQDRSSTETISREQLARWIIEDLGFEEVANLQGIYTTGFEDESQISKDCLGFVALAKGFNLMTAKEGNKFQPTAKVTRLEAVELFFKLIEQRK